MQTILKHIIILYCCTLSLTTQAQQQYTGTDYTLKNGLPVESIKWAEQDTMGNIWMATDEGLLAFDGINFTHYNGQTKPFLSSYFKFIFRCNDGKMLAAGYKGVYEIVQTPDSVLFKFFPDSLHNATKILDDVKNIYQTTDGKIWFGEKKTISCWNGKKLRTHDLGNKSFSDDYFRSFQFFETQQGDFYTISYTGWVYYYNKTTDQFVEIGKISNNPNMQISSVCVVNQRIFVANNSDVKTGGGLYELTISANQSFQWVQISSVSFISHISFNKLDQSLLLTHFTGGMSQYDLDTRTLTPMQGTGNIKTYGCKLMPDQSLCIATEKGLLIRNRNYLQFIFRGYTNYIASNSKNVYVQASDSIFQIVEAKPNILVKEYYFEHLSYRMTVTENHLFLSQKPQGLKPVKIYKLTGNKIQEYTTHSPNDLFFMEATSDGSVWMCQGNIDSLMRLTPDGVLKYYGKNAGINTQCVVVRQDKKTGRIVAGSNDERAYILAYNPQTDKFESISKPNNVKVLSDLAFDSNGTVYVAAQGVFRIDADSARLISGQYSNYLFKSIAIDHNNNVYASANELYKISNNEIIRFGEETGLVAVPNYRKLHIDNKKRLWIGTPLGLNMMLLDTPMNTHTPFLVKLETEGKVQFKDFETARITAGSYLHLQVNIRSYPNNAILFEYRIKGSQNNWTACTKQNEIFIPELHRGIYNIEIRALKTGNYNYSDVQSYTFTVHAPWYLSWWFISLLLLMLVAIIWAFIKVNSARLLRQKRRLEQIVKERTAEIEQQKNEVQTKNLELERNRNELQEQREQIASAFNELKEKNDEIEIAYQNMQEANELISEKNQLLQQQAHQLKLANNDILDKNNLLKQQHQEVQQAYQALEKQKAELENTLHTLQTTQKKLVEAEKMASLGNLVAGVAHEINTPVGVAITSISTVINEIKELVEKYENGDMSSKDFETYIQQFYDASTLALKNLERTAGLVRSFKQISLDQHSEQERKFNLNDYLHDIVASINPEFKHTQIKIAIDCPNDLVINSYPGTFAQIFTNLLTNSKRHGFRNRNEGQINIVVKRENEKLMMEYTDNGHGIAANVLPRIFDPFFTTDMQAGTGLGLNILYNLVTQKLSGEIRCESKEGEGVKFLMTL